jgi:hypothetical protein
MTQIYRSLNLFEHCIYSLLDLAIFEWHELLERPRLIVEMMIKNATEVLTDFHSVKPVIIPKHIMRQIHNTGLPAENNKLASLIEFKHIGSVTKSPLSKKPEGFIVTSLAKFIAEGDEATSIEFV